MNAEWQLDRRRLFQSWLAAGAGAFVGAELLHRERLPTSWKPQLSRVAVLKVDSYSERLVDVLRDSLKLFDLNLRGKSVLLKPNQVDIVPGKEVTTHPMVVAAATECFLQLGARRVLVGEGPGH